MMSSSEIVATMIANLQKLADPKLSKEEFDSLSEKTLQMLAASHNISKSEDEQVFLSLLRLHCVNAINFLQGAKMQGEFNRKVASMLKETGKDVTTLDSYLNENVRPYFPDHDPSSK